MKPGPDVSGVPECVSCGACCFSKNERYLQVAGVDYERLGEDAERLTVFLENRAYMRLSDGHCAALTFDVETKRYLCSIYERRPDVCHWLERGSGQCAAERHEKADRPIALRLRVEAEQEPAASRDS
jgi:Fe-S-cluster containining protein